MAKPLSLGALAPDFQLDADGDRQLSLSSYRPGKVVIFFYPKDDTRGCTQEAKDFTGLKQKFAAADTSIVGISADGIASHNAFKRKHDLDVDLASDPDHQVLENYGVWTEQKMYGRTYMGIERSTFLIDRRGRLAKVWRKVTVAGHADAVLAAARTLD